MFRKTNKRLCIWHFRSLVTFEDTLSTDQWDPNKTVIDWKINGGSNIARIGEVTERRNNNIVFVADVVLRLKRHYHI